MILIWSKCFPSHFSRLSQDDDHEGAHEEACIGLLIIPIGRVMEQLYVLIALVAQQPAQFPDKLVRTCQVHRAEVRVKWLIYQFLEETKSTVEIKLFETLTLSMLKK